MKEKFYERDLNTQCKFVRTKKKETKQEEDAVEKSGGDVLYNSATILHLTLVLSIDIGVNILLDTFGYGLICLICYSTCCYIHIIKEKKDLHLLPCNV